MATDLGKVGMRLRGTYNAANTYEVLDVVTYNNGLYIAKTSVPANTAPTNTTYWQVGLDLSNIYPIDQALTIPSSGSLTIGTSGADVNVDSGKTSLTNASSILAFSLSP